MKSQQKIHHLSSLSSIVQVPPQEFLVILDEKNTNITTKIVLAEGASIDLYSARTGGKLNIEVIHAGPYTTSHIYAGFHAPENGKIEATIKSVFQESYAISEIHILSLADSLGEVLLDSAITIEEGTKHGVGRLKERHIFLGSGGKIRGIPALIVHSDDIEASHALAIDRISDEELFYLRSRGFARDDATSLLLDGAISEIFSGLESLDGEVYARCKGAILRA